MARVGVLRTVEGGSVTFHCPGCNKPHRVRVEPAEGEPCWGFNGDYDRPTFTPSVMVRYPRSASTISFEDFRCEPRCHSVVTDGQIQFLGDSFHDLRGQTVSLAPHGI